MIKPIRNEKYLCVRVIPFRLQWFSSGRTHMETVFGAVHHSLSMGRFQLRFF